MEVFVLSQRKNKTYVEVATNVQIIIAAKLSKATIKGLSVCAGSTESSDHSIYTNQIAGVSVQYDHFFSNLNHE